MPRLGYGIGVGAADSVAGPYFALGTVASQLAPIWAPHENDYTTSLAWVTAGGTTRAFRAPNTVRLANGQLAMFVVGSEAGTSQDYMVSSIWLKLSDNDGDSWGPAQIIYRRSDFSSGTKWINGPCVPVVHSSGRVHVLFTKSDATTPGTDDVMTLWSITSADNCATWSHGTPSSGNETNISSTTIKTNNTTPANLPAAYGGSNASWPWYMITSGICIQSGANAGRIVCAGDHRYVLGNKSWSHSIYTDNGDSATPTWALGGGFDETVAANDYSNECEVMEISGGLYFNCRVESGSSTNKRGQATLTGAITDTWPTMTAMSTGSADIAANNVHAGSLTHSDGSLWMTFPVNVTDRSHLRCYRSTDSGVSWPQVRSIYFGDCGYSELVELRNGFVHCGFEQSHNMTNDVFFQYIQQARFNKPWFTSSSIPEVFDYQFNELASTEGTASTANAGGTLILDHGDLGNRVFDQRGKGGSAATYSASGVTFAGSGNPITLQESQAAGIGGAFDAGLGSLTIEVDATLQSGSRMILDNANGADANTEYGFGFGLNGFGRLQLRVRDSSTVNGVSAATTVPGSGTLADGVRRTYIGIIDRTNNLLQTKHYVGSTGTLTSYGTQASLASVTGSIYGSQNTVLGAQADGTLPLAANSIVHRVRITRGVRTGGWISSLDDKQPLNGIWGYQPNTTETGSPATITGAVSWRLPTRDGGAYARLDQYGAWDRPQMPLVRGQGMIAGRDVISNKRFTFGGSLQRGAFLDYDSDVGPFWRPMFSSSSAMGHLLDAAVDTSFNFVHETNRFWIFFVAKHFADATGAIVDTVNNANTTRGFGVYVTSGTRALTLRISDAAGAGAIPFNEGATGITLAVNTWTAIGVTGDGTGTKATWFKATISGGVVSSVTTAQSTNNLVTNTGDLTAALSWGAYTNANSGLSWAAKNLAMGNTLLSQSDFLAMCEYSKAS